VPALQRAELHDITVRDGGECADVAFPVDDKVRIVEALSMVGLWRTGWREAVRAIMGRKLPINLALASCALQRLATAGQLQNMVVECERARIACHRPLKDEEVLSIAAAGGATSIT
jgi:hypothetical protein